MNESGASVTCLPVQFDHGQWESAIFFCVGGVECKQDRRILKRLTGVLPVGIEVDLIEHANAAVIVIRLEVYTSEDNPLIGEVLLAPGHIESHFQTATLLSSQSSLKWFFGDAAYWIIHSQQNRLTAKEHAAFSEVCDNAVRHDSLIRITGRYDVHVAMDEVLSHYHLRSNVHALSSR